MIGARGVVLTGKIIRGGVWMGIPVQPIDDYKRQIAMLRGLARMKDELKEIRARIAQSDNPNAKK